MSSIGKSGARSSGPTGCPVPGCSTGCGAVGMSERMLYQRRGRLDPGGNARLGRHRSAFESGNQGLDVIRVVVPDTVDVEAGRAVDAAPHAAHEVLADPGGVDMLRQLSVELLDVEPERLRIGSESRIL